MPIRHSRRSHVLRTALAALALAQASCAVPIPADVPGAVTASHRPATDRLRDATRKPDQVMAFAGIKPGDKVAELMADTGYYTRILCTLVRETGHLYVVSIAHDDAIHGDASDTVCSNATPIVLRVKKRPAPELWSSSDDPGIVYEYWSFTPAAETFATPEPLDAIWIAEHYHDLHTVNVGSPNLQLVNRALWNALKSGGVLLIEDYVAAPSSSARDATSLHRIDPEQVKREVMAAGFEFVGASKVLRRHDDPHTANAHALNDAADRFLLKFRKR